MSWFKTDDRLHAHRKTRKLTRSHADKTRDAAPFGLWVLAGSWSGQNATDGWVPESELDRWDDDWPEMARRLVDAELWWPEDRNGEHGFGFVNWEEYNPSASQPTDSGRFGAHVRWHVKRKVVVSDCPHCPTEPDPISVPDDTPDSTLLAPYMGADGGPTWDPIALPDPTRPVPDPTRPESARELALIDEPGSAPAAAVAAPSRRGSRLPADWFPTRTEANLRAEAGRTREHLDHELEKFRDHWAAAPGGKGVKADWDATWRNWIKRSDEYAPRSNGRPVTAAALTEADWSRWMANAIAADEANERNAS